MGWSQRLKAYLKTTRIIKMFLHVFEYFYIRWRVMRTTSSDFDQEEDSHDSSYYEANRRRIVRTNSVYPPVCPTSLRGGAVIQKPTCIELYKKFMSYGAMDDFIPGHIFLSNSASSYAANGTSLCQLSQSDSDSDFLSSPSWSDEIVQDSDLNSDNCSEIDSDEYACRKYRKWIESGKMYKRRRMLPLTPTEQLDENSYENVYLRQVAEELEQRRVLYDSLEAQYLPESYSRPSECASTDMPEEYDSNSSDYQTASISSPSAKKICIQIDMYWRVEDHNEDGAVGARDNYHNRYFGKAGYYLTRNAIQNQANGKDTMPGVERRALEVERRRWTEINRRGERYEDVELGLPDTNGVNTNHWVEEYEEPLPLHTCTSWKTPKRYTPRYNSLF
uniref:Uncharacterized protein n=2 Tax=Caenorhabditis tropicalis TaxID=1561998 RepID=A0A1I7U7G9_9PELO